MEAAVIDAGLLPLRSSLEGMGRVASTISMFWEASFSFGGSLGAFGGKGRLEARGIGEVYCLLSVLGMLCSLGGDVGCGKSFG